MANSIKGDVREYISGIDGGFTKTDVAEWIWPNWHKSGLKACNDWRCFRSYVGNLVLLEKAAGSIVETTADPYTCAKTYVRAKKRPVKTAAKLNTNLSSVSTEELMAELCRRVDVD